MTYEEWNNLTEEQQLQVSNEELPSIPVEELDNNIVRTQMTRKDGQLGWLSTQKKLDNSETTEWFPIYRSGEMENYTAWYKFNPKNIS